ncbi:MAG: PIN domain-containing protein [Akkermansiaceae bacterium]
MILFFDTNILLDIALRREPHFERSHAVLREGIENHSCFMSWHTVSNIAYILEKFESAENAVQFIASISGVCRIAPVQHEDLLTAFQYNQGDFEDAMQIAAALACHAELIVTRDAMGFTKSPIPVTSSLQ